MQYPGVGYSFLSIAVSAIFSYPPTLLNSHLRNFLFIPLCSLWCNQLWCGKAREAGSGLDPFTGSDLGDEVHFSYFPHPRLRRCEYTWKNKRQLIAEGLIGSPSLSGVKHEVHSAMSRTS